MSKRAGEHDDGPLKGGHRPDAMDIDDKADDGMGEFEDEFEDEFESEDEILEAGVDGRPDAEREAEEKAGGLRRDRPIAKLVEGGCDQTRRHETTRQVGQRD